MLDAEPQYAPTLPFAPHSPDPSRPPEGVPAELIEPSGPGLETLWGFLLRTEPHTLYLMVNPIGGLIRDERRARKLATRMGSPFRLRPVTAPELIAAGLQEVGSYGPDVLYRVFPENP